jgi:hypothetical protein
MPEASRTAELASFQAVGVLRHMCGRRTIPPVWLAAMRVIGPVES